MAQKKTERLKKDGAPKKVPLYGKTVQPTERVSLEAFPLETENEGLVAFSDSLSKVKADTEEVEPFKAPPSEPKRLETKERQQLERDATKKVAEAMPSIRPAYLLEVVRAAVCIWQISAHIRGRSADLEAIQAPLEVVLPILTNANAPIPRSAFARLREGDIGTLEHLNQLGFFPEMEDLDAAFAQCHEYLAWAEAIYIENAQSKASAQKTGEVHGQSTPSVTADLTVEELARVLKIAAAMLLIASYPFGFLPVSRGVEVKHPPNAVLFGAYRNLPSTILEILTIPERMMLDLQFDTWVHSAHRDDKFSGIFKLIDHPKKISDSDLKPLQRLTKFFPSRDSLWAAFAPYIRLRKDPELGYSLPVIKKDSAKTAGFGSRKSEDELSEIFDAARGKEIGELRALTAAITDENLSAKLFVDIEKRFFGRLTKFVDVLTGNQARRALQENLDALAGRTFGDDANDQWVALLNDFMKLRGYRVGCVSPSCENAPSLLRWAIAGKPRRHVFRTEHFDNHGNQKKHGGMSEIPRLTVILA